MVATFLEQPLASTPHARDAVAAAYRKVTWRLIPFLFLCYVLSFLDRINIGYAQLQVKQDLALSDAAYGLGASVFFIAYVLFEVPSNVLLARIGARRTLFRIMFLWGLASAAMMFVQTPLQFALVRFLLGAFEAGFFPGVVLYLTYWYPSGRRSRITALFMLGLIVAGLMAGPLSTGIMTGLHGVQGLRGWQWMFLLEGLPSTLLGIVAWFYLTDRPEDAKWLSADEKAVLRHNLEADRSVRQHAAKDSWKRAVRDSRVYLLSLINFCAVAAGYAVTFWLPVIIKGFGVTDIMHVGLYSTLPYLLGGAAMLFWGQHSDRKLERRWHFAIGAVVAAVGFYMVTASAGHLLLAMISISIAFAAVVAILPIFWTIPPLLLSGSGAAVGVALINALSATGGIVAPWMIGVVKTSTGSINNALYVIAAALLIGAALMVWAVPAKLLRERHED
jgi:D-galactonate transporter